MGARARSSAGGYGGGLPVGTPANAPGGGAGQWVIPLREWAAAALCSRAPGGCAAHVLSAREVEYLPASQHPPLGRSGVLISYIMEQKVGDTPLGSDSATLSQYRAALAAALAPHVGTVVDQLPTSLTVGIAAPSAPDPWVDMPGAIVDGLLGGVGMLLAGLGPLIVGAIVLVAILVLIYLGIRRTFLQ